MELFPDLYEENPFEQKIAYRVEGAAQMDAKSLYQLFVKNLVAFVFYETNYHSYHEYYTPSYQGTVSDQEFIYHHFFRGILLTEIEDSVAISPLLYFCKYETLFNKNVCSEDLDAYMNFIYDHTTVFKRIDSLVNLPTRLSVGEEFMGYLSSNNLVYPYLNIALLGTKLEDFFMNVCEVLRRSYLYNFDEQDFFLEDFSKDFLRIRLAMKLDLLEAQDQIDIVKYSYKWLTYRFKEFGMSYGIDATLLPEDKTFLFDAVLDQFATYFSFTTGLVASSKDFPKYVFSRYEGYLLFDTLATGLYAKVTVSYVYRFLFEKGLIVLKDTPFREWYNAQDYPIRLESATETLQKSTSSDRVQFVAIVAKLLGVTI